MQRFDTGRQIEVWKIIQPHIYKEGQYSMIDFQGTRSDYKNSMIFYNITKNGNIKVGNVTSTREGGVPSNIRKRIAQLKQRDGQYYWWIEDGTGSLVFKVRG